MDEWMDGWMDGMHRTHTMVLLWFPLSLSLSVCVCVCVRGVHLNGSICEPVQEGNAAAKKGDSATHHYRLLTTVHIDEKSAVISLKLHHNGGPGRPLVVTPDIAVSGLVALGKYILSPCVSFLTLPLQQLMGGVHHIQRPYKLLYDIYTSGTNEEKQLVEPIVKFFEAVRWEMFHSEEDADGLASLALFNDVEEIHETGLAWVCRPGKNNRNKHASTIQPAGGPPMGAAAGGPPAN